MKRFIQKICFFGVLAIVTGGLLTACSSAKPDKQKNSKDTSSVVIGVTNAIETLNPLLGGGKEVDKYAIGFSFLPLVELNQQLAFESQLAKDITTDDNITFTVHIDPEAKWSDGKDITSDDVIFSILRMTSPEMLNPNIFSYAQIKGFDENGNSPTGADSVEGLVKVDDKTLNILGNSPMTLTSFQNTFARYIFTVPKHVLQDVSAKELATYKWFNQPEVISGPYFLKDLNSENYATFAANKKYWKGAPEIANLSIKVTDNSQLYTGLTSGEIDFVQQTMGTIAQSDYENVKKLETIETVLDQPVTNQIMFLNNGTITDVHLRQAILLGINREKILSDMLNGNGQINDGFLSSFSPYYDNTIKPTAYDPKKAKELLKKSDYDSNKTLKFVINSGDKVFAQVADTIVAQLKEIGIKAQVESVNLSTLTTRAADHDYDLLAVQYTMSPVDPYPDLEWLINSEGDWPDYQSSQVAAGLDKVKAASDEQEIKAGYREVTKAVQDDLPFFSVYFIRSLGAVNQNLKNAEPHTYGSFNNIHTWTFK